MDDPKCYLDLRRHVDPKVGAGKGWEGRPAGGCGGDPHARRWSLEVLSRRADQIRRKGPQGWRGTGNHSVAVGRSGDGAPPGGGRGQTDLAKEMINSPGLPTRGRGQGIARPMR